MTAPGEAMTLIPKGEGKETQGMTTTEKPNRNPYNGTVTEHKGHKVHCFACTSESFVYLCHTCDETFEVKIASHQ